MRIWCLSAAIERSRHVWNVISSHGDYASGDRTEAVRGIQVPALVIHGDSDPLIDVAAGRRTAQLIEGAELLVIPGMGHDLPRQVRPVMADALGRVAGRAERTG